MPIDSYKEKWDESYARYENFIFYPKEEVVKFLNNCESQNSKMLHCMRRTERN